MARRSIRNNKHLVDLVNSITLPALKLLAELDPFDFLRSLDWERPSPDLRQDAVDTIAQLDRLAAGQAEREAIRILQLCSWRSEELLEYAARTLGFESPPAAIDFDPSADVMTRLVWLLVKASHILDQIETIFLAHHFHGYKKYKPFKVRDGNRQNFVWSEEIGQKLQKEVGRILALDEPSRDNCEVIHFEMDEASLDGASAQKTLHYLVVYHPGKMKLLRQMKDHRRDILAFYPALEATLIYDATENQIMVLADRKATREALAECFSRIGFAKPLSRQPLEEVFYDLSVFKSPLDLKAARVPGAIIDNAWMSSMTVSLGHTPHRVTLTLYHDANIWNVSGEHFGEVNPVTRSRSIHEVNLSFVVRFDGEGTSKALDISISNRGSCNLMNLTDPKLRRCGEDILVSLGIMKRIDAAQHSGNAAQFLSELELLDQPSDEVDGYLLRHLGLDAAALVDQGLIRKKDVGQSITVVTDDEETGIVYRRLEVQSDSRHTWAEDPVMQTRFDLDEGDLRRYAVGKGWLRERLTHLLSAQLSGCPIDPDPQEPFLLGYYQFGDQEIPVSFATQLWHDKHAGAIDVELRKQNLGVGVVLTTTQRRHRKFLGSSIVVPIESLLDRSSEQVTLVLSRIEPELRRWKGQAETVDQPKLIRESHGAILVGSWSEVWALSKPEQIPSIDALVKAWHAGKRKCTTEQVLAGYAGARSVPERFRSDPLWTTFIRSGDGHKRSRSWELNIGKPDYDMFHDADPESL